jgi:signal transduction histidine kinase
MPQEITFGIAIVVVVFLFLIVWLLFFLVYYQRKKRNFIEEQQRMEANFKIELTRVEQEIQEETIKQIGHELHDNIGQLVTLAKIHLQNLMRSNADNQLSEIHGVVSKALEELRSLSKSLDTSPVEKLSLEELLEKDRDRINKLGHIQIIFETLGQREEIESKKKIILYRMIQEITTNALKHAKCENIKVSIEYGVPNITFTISDNGTGFDTSIMESNKNSGSGLRHLKNRVTILGGQLNLVSSKETGTKYEIICPKSSICITK